MYEPYMSTISIFFSMYEPYMSTISIFFHVWTVYVHLFKTHEALDQAHAGGDFTYQAKAGGGFLEDFCLDVLLGVQS